MDMNQIYEVIIRKGGVQFTCEVVSDSKELASKVAHEYYETTNGVPISIINSTLLRPETTPLEMIYLNQVIKSQVEVIKED